MHVKWLIFSPWTSHNSITLYSTNHEITTSNQYQPQDFYDRTLSLETNNVGSQKPTEYLTLWGRNKERRIRFNEEQLPRLKPLFSSKTVLNYTIRIHEDNVFDTIVFYRKATKTTKYLLNQWSLIIHKTHFHM